MSASGAYRKSAARIPAGMRNSAVRRRRLRARRRSSGTSNASKGASEAPSVVMTGIHQEYGAPSPPEWSRRGHRPAGGLLAELLLVVILEDLRAVVVGLPVDALERGLDLVEGRVVGVVVGLEPVGDEADIAWPEEALGQLAPLAMIDRPAVRELDVRGKAPVHEDLGQDR